MKTSLVFCLMILGAAAGLGCQHGKDASEKASSKVAEQYEPLEIALVRDSRYQPDVKMMASAEGDTVTVQIQNFSNKLLGVEPINFGVIREGETDVIPFDPETQAATFPKIGLKKGEIASGTLTFSGIGKLPGNRLVFSHSQVRPSLAYITGEGAKPIAVPKKVQKPATKPVRKK